MVHHRRAVLLLCAALACGVAAGFGGTAGAVGQETFPNLPPDWEMTSSVIVPAEQASQIGGKLGGKVSQLSNTVFAVKQVKLQVNLFTCPTEDDAKAIQGRLLKTKGNPACCLRQGAKVVELVSDDMRAIILAGYVLEFVPTEATYRVSFTVAPVAQCDYMASNQLFNLFLARAGAGQHGDGDAQIAELAKRFTFGDSLDLRALPGTDKPENPGYTFSQAPTRIEWLAGGEILRVRFDGLPRDAGVPYVRVSGVVRVKAFAPVPTTRKADAALQGATRYWPCDDPKLQKLAREITGNAAADADKVQALLDWMTPGKHLKFAGEVVGSRFGVKRTLEQGFGHCWDFSDLFVTLCRAAGVPCRQVGGWLYGQSGHIWAEVLVDGKAWQQVDPTCGLPCGSLHVPYFTSEDGEMPIVYLAMPKIEQRQND